MELNLLSSEEHFEPSFWEDNAGQTQSLLSWAEPLAKDDTGEYLLNRSFDKGP